MSLDVAHRPVEITDLGAQRGAVEPQVPAVAHGQRPLDLGQGFLVVPAPLVDRGNLGPGLRVVAVLRGDRLEGGQRSRPRRPMRRVTTPRKKAISYSSGLTAFRTPARSAARASSKRRASKSR